jgi:heme exporter protein C
MIKSKVLSTITMIAAVFLLFYISYCNYVVFLLVPNEKIMGAVQRIFYFHVGSATASYVSLAVLLLTSMMYLSTRNKDADHLARAAAEVGFVLCTIVLISGMIWGHSAWNTWFSWEPRLVTFLLLWLLLLAYNVLRAFADDEKAATHAAVLGIISAVNVPIVIYSIKLLPNIAQLHPVIVEKQGLKDPLFISAMFYCMAGMIVLQFLLILIRWRIGRLEAGKGE